MIHLLYFEGCPNIERARENLAEAVRRAGLAAKWEEVDTGRPGVPQGWKGFASPTVLVNGADVVTGERSASGESACGMGGAPAVEVILKALKSAAQ